MTALPHSRSFVVLVGALIVLVGANVLASADSAQPGPEDLIFVTDDNSIFWPGCDAISVIDSRTGNIIVRGKQHISPGRLAATSSGSLALSVSNNSGQFIVSVATHPADPERAAHLFRRQRAATVVP